MGCNSSSRGAREKRTTRLQSAGLVDHSDTFEISVRPLQTIPEATCPTCSFLSRWTSRTWLHVFRRNCFKRSIGPLLACLSDQWVIGGLKLRQLIFPDQLRISKHPKRWFDCVLTLGLLFNEAHKVMAETTGLSKAWGGYVRRWGREER